MQPLGFRSFGTASRPTAGGDKVVFMVMVEDIMTRKEDYERRRQTEGLDKKSRLDDLANQVVK